VGDSISNYRVKYWSQTQHYSSHHRSSSFEHETS